MRRVLVTGSRKWVDRNAIWNALAAELNYFQDGIIVIHGGALGADDIADRWAWGMLCAGWPVEIETHRADWDAHGKRAGPIRNQQMVDRGADVCHAFPLEDSIGTRHCMARAMAAHIPVVNHGYLGHTFQALESARAYG